MSDDSKRVPLLDEQARGGATLAEAIVSLVKVCVGSGVMALPWAFVQGGVLSLPGVVALVLWNGYTSYQLIACRDAVEVGGAATLQGHRSVYSALAHIALGRAGVLVLEGSLVIVLLGACASMQIQAAQLLDATVPHLHYGGLVVGGGIILVPLVLQRTLRGISIIALLGLVVLCVGLVLCAARGIASNGVPTLPSELAASPSPSGFAAFFGVAAFSFGGTQATILPIQEGMRHPRKAATALAAALLAAGALYAIVGLSLACIYAPSSEGVQQMIILNLPRSSQVGLAVKWCTAMVALLSYPLPFMPVVQLLLPPTEDVHVAPRRETTLRLALLTVSTTVALAA